MQILASAVFVLHLIDLNKHSARKLTAMLSISEKQAL